MFKGFEANGSVDFIQPHEQWDHYASTIPPPMFAASSTSFLERNQLFHWAENVTKQLIEDQPPLQTDVFCNDQSPRLLYENDHTVLDGTMGEYRSKKVARSENNDSPGWCHGPGEQAIIYNNTGTGTYTDTGAEARTGVVENKSMSLMTLLMECAVALSNDNLNEAQRMLLELTQVVSPYGPSCAERVVAYFAKAMSSRVINSWLGICSPLINHKTVHKSFQVFNNVAPFVKFAHFTSNQAILEALHRQTRVHIIDLDIMQGLQWPALFHILATRSEGPPVVKLTGMGASMDLLVETGKQLSNFAKRMGMSFEFFPLAKKFGELDISDLQIQNGEAVAVHWYQHSLYDSTGSDWRTMRLLQEISPKVITLVEQEIVQGGSFLDRFVSSLHFYSTIFDSLGAHLACDDTNRHKVEHGLLSKEINNVLAIGGPARSGEEKGRQWRNEMVKNGFGQVPMSTNSMAQAQLIVNMFPPSYGYSLVQGDGTLRLGWKGTSLFSVSSWTSVTSPTTAF